MTKNTKIFIALLAVLAVGVGYSKYALLPKYQAQLDTQVVPVVTPAAVANTLETQKSEEDTQALAFQKILQVTSLSMNVPVSTKSASYLTLLKTQPGFVTLVGAEASTASAQKTMSVVTAATDPQMGNFFLFGFSRTGKSPKLCTYDPKCLEFLETLNAPISISEYIDASASATASRSATDAAMTAFTTGSTILNISPQSTTSEVEELLLQLTQRYLSYKKFQELVDGNVTRVETLKKVYH